MSDRELCEHWDIPDFCESCKKMRAIYTKRRAAVDKIISYCRNITKAFPNEYTPLRDALLRMDECDEKVKPFKSNPRTPSQCGCGAAEWCARCHGCEDCCECDDVLETQP